MAVSTDNLYGLDRPALESRVCALGARAFHGRQIYRWLYGRRRLDPTAWTDLPAGLRDSLARACRFEPGTIDARTEASDGTVKYRIATDGGGAVEAVAMVQSGRKTLCLSSQVGCALDCRFCLTATMGLVRHLGPGEILGQVHRIVEDRGWEDVRFNLVFMGMGEPLHNYEPVMAAVRALVDPQGFAISRRRITVSTAGLAPAIERLAEEPVRPRLAVSLNATTDDVRDGIMPINRRYPLARLLEACRRFVARTGDALTFEYVLLHGVNDTDADVERLSRVARSHAAKLNLIPFNPVPGHLPYEATPRQRVVNVRDRLLDAGVAVSVRFSRGAEARAACGQLAVLPGEGAEIASPGRRRRRKPS